MFDAKIYYENFLCESFQLPDRPLVGRHGDPAGLADTDHFTQDNINQIRAGIAYAICIRSNVLVNVVNVNYKLIDDSFTKLLARALSIKTLADATSVVTDTKTETEKYIHMINGAWRNSKTDLPITDKII